jgi:hypothetical protein
MQTNVATKRQNTSALWQSAEGILNEGYEGRWTGRAVPMVWSARSPKLNPLGFFLWGCVEPRLHHGGKSEARHHLVEVTDKPLYVQETNW